MPADESFASHRVFDDRSNSNNLWRQMETEMPKDRIYTENSQRMTPLTKFTSQHLYGQLPTGRNEILKTQAYMNGFS